MNAFQVMTAKKPKISIITINYNHAAGLEKTMASVLSQNQELLEYVVIDGGSTDESTAIIKKFESQLAYWVSEKDRGIYHAMNKGIAASSGEYLLFLNSGDCLADAEVIQKLISSHLDQDLIYGNLLMVEADKEWIWVIPSTLTFQQLYESTIPHPSTLIKKSLFEQVGNYDEHLKIVSDWKFFLLALAKHNCSYRHIDLVVTRYQMDGLSSNPENLKHIEAERKQVLETHFPLFMADYHLLKHQQQELKKINYFIKTRKFFKKILKQK